ncbi:lactonase family protein [Sodalis sp. RH22]|uniref:lactonase family protein n=1 Tax=unclassified Sodalis (in: enterobacteria) TaxID=2636512 RepID=UPI0039B3C967
MKITCNRRTPLSLLLLAALTTTLAGAAHAATYAYVSNADSADISVFSLNEADGALTPVQTLAVGGTVMPLALSPDKQHLYAGLRSKPYQVLSLAINPADGRLTQRQAAPLAESMAYIATDRTGRWLFSASYGGNLLAVNAINQDGLAGDVRQIIKTGPMAHAIRSAPDNRYVFASVLGADAWLRLRLDAKTGQLTQDQAPAYTLPAKSGPRHFVFSPDKRFTYLIDELDGKLHVLAFNQNNDRVKPVQTISILPADFSGDKPWGADLHLTPDGHFLFASERTSSTLAAYRVDKKSGRLTRIGTWPTEKQPRGFNIDPSGQYLLAVGQLSPQMSVYRIDKASGALESLGRYPVGKGANWIEMVKY